ncbi:hypothetical protein R3P38DRAFT_2820640 [Favolaschia claudopus]|uniref:Uncharacterized protein n=1 Tax=Favolaschia claudopus TaxID=2862362 RepID=A0AAW0EDV9_9AGAR
MLGRLSASVSRLSWSEKFAGDERLSLDLETFKLVVSVPDIRWGHVAEICERAMNPMARGLYSILERDMENVAEIFAALELHIELEEAQKVPSSQMSTPTTATNGDLVLATSPIETMSVSSPDPLVDEDPSIPVIVITSCPSEPFDSSAAVPYQDSAFRTHLTVPKRPVFNTSFPPMMPPSGRDELSWHSASKLEWAWRDGHWRASLQGLRHGPRTLPRRKTRPAPIPPIYKNLTPQQLARLLRGLQDRDVSQKQLEDRRYYKAIAASRTHS